VKVITITNHKGGVGKTTVTCNLASGISRLKKSNGDPYNLLILDLDPQGNASQTMLKKGENATNTLTEALAGTPIMECIYPTVQKGLSIIPSNLVLFQEEIKMLSSPSCALFIKDLFSLNKSYLKRFDYIIIDSPPNLGPFMMNAIAVCHYYIVPLEMGSLYSLLGINNLEERVLDVQRGTGTKGKLLGYLLNKYDGRTSAGQQMKSQVKHFYKDQVLDTVIRKNTTIERAQSSNKSIFSFDLSSYGAKDFSALSNEVVMKIESR